MVGAAQPYYPGMCLTCSTGAARKGNSWAACLQILQVQQPRLLRGFRCGCGTIVWLSRVSLEGELCTSSAGGEICMCGACVACGVTIWSVCAGSSLVRCTA